jgi:hypothetical protein
MDRQVRGEGKKRIKGKGVGWEEPKKSTSLFLTPTARKKLDDMAESLGLSRSELVEQIARGELKREYNPVKKFLFYWIWWKDG